MNEKMIAEIKAFSEKMHELAQKVHAMNVKYPSAICSREEMHELCVYTRDDKYIIHGLKVAYGYNKDIPKQLCLSAFVIDKDKPAAEWSMNIFRGLMGDIEEYLEDESKYPEIRGYLSILHERMMLSD